MTKNVYSTWRLASCRRNTRFLFIPANGGYLLLYKDPVEQAGTTIFYNTRTYFRILYSSGII